jgi:murein DD-endopeptidase MepM/ murein hydrolase activator NlpD
MRQSAYGVGYGRLAFGVLGAACAALALGACSSASRFDSLGFSSSQASQADLSTTAALPIPQESVYGTGNSSGYANAAGAGAPRYYGNSNGQVARSSLPPAQDYSAPRAMQAAYTPPEPPQPQANLRAPQPAPAVLYGGANPASGFRVKAGKGDTLSVLSRRYGVPVESIQAANNLPDGRLSAGQELIIPTVRKPATPAETPKAQVAAATSNATTDASPAVRVVKTTTIQPPGAPSADASPEETTNGVSASQEITGEPKTRVANIGQLPAPQPMSGNSFRWPVKGRVIAGFGTKPDGGHNDGINLAVPQGTSVKAAENGVVAYAGNELKGYGNLVLVRHANNWVSAYAHNEEILVKRGDQVRRGQVIAKAGATGSVSSPQVHFELRKGSRPVDPTKYMADAAASAD